jgi:hypothetical protein
MLSAYLPDALAGVYLPQDPDLVFCAVSLSFHGLWAWLSQRLTHHLAQIREVTSIATRLGVMAFRRLSNLGYNRLVMTLVTISGISLIVKGWGYWSGGLAKIDHLILLHL